MKLIGFFLFAGFACAQEITPDTVIGKVNDRPITLAEARRMIIGIAPEGVQLLQTDPQTLLSRLYLFRKLAELAEKDGLHERSPLKEQLELQRTEVLGRAEVNERRNLSNPSSEEAEKYYNDNKTKFEQAKVRVIYISFAPDGAPQAAGPKKSLKEPEAKVKAEGLVKQLRAGADFGKLAREHSEDEASAKKDGDFPPLKRTDSGYPAEVITTIFSLQPKEISAPLKLANGFYIFRLDEKTLIPFPEVREKIFNDMAQDRFTEWFKKLQKQFEVKLDKPEALKAPGAALPARPQP